jgi:DNA-binding HxlR family transcriptional regulator
MSQNSPPRRSPLSPQDCHLARAFDVIGDRWTLLVLRSALFGVRRFDDFAAELGAPRTVLADRLKWLTAAGLLARRDYREPGRRARPEYWLTPKGAELRLPFLALTRWSDLWLADGEPPPWGGGARAGGGAPAPPPAAVRRSRAPPARPCGSRWSTARGARSRRASRR